MLWFIAAVLRSPLLLREAAGGRAFASDNGADVLPDALRAHEPQPDDREDGGGAEVSSTFEATRARPNPVVRRNDRHV